MKIPQSFLTGMKGNSFVIGHLLSFNFSGWISTRIWISPCPTTTSTPRTTHISAADSSGGNPASRCTDRSFWPAAAVWSWTVGTARGRTRNPSSHTARPCALTSSSKMSSTPSEIVLSWHQSILLFCHLKTIAVDLNNIKWQSIVRTVLETYSWRKH